MQTPIATIGITGPKGAVNPAGFTAPASAGDRKRSVAAADPPYISSRASALTSAICAKDPLSARVSATADVKMMALAGVRYVG